MRVVNGARAATLALARGRRPPHPAGGESRNSGVPARQRRLRQYSRGGCRALQPHGAARAHPGREPRRGPGDIPELSVVPPMSGMSRASSRARSWHTPRQRSGAAAGSHARSGAALPAYVSSNSDGDDGAPFTDYDLIGSQIERTGLFALDSSDYFNLLCVPPLSRERDVGPSTLLVAARYCKERGALLIVDPPYAWHTADDALRGSARLGFRQRECAHVFPAHPGARQIARPFRVVCALRRSRGHARAER